MRKFAGIGNLGRDPELRSTKSGTAVCSASAAFEDGWGENKTTMWLKVVAWGKMAENFEQFCQKGSQIYVDGRLEQESWKDRDGNSRESLKVTASTLEFLGPKADNSDRGYQTPSEGEDVPF